MSTVMSEASRYAAVVARNPQLQHAAVRLGLWLVAAAEQQGTWPVEAHQFNFMNGFDRRNVKMSGIHFRAETIKKSIAALEEAGLLAMEEGDHVSGGRKSTLYTLILD